MIPGPTHIIACPYCNAIAKVFTLKSGNTLEANYWTDGKVTAPMLPDTNAIAKCHNCHHFYWLAEATVIGEIDPFKRDTRYPQAWDEAVRVKELSAAEYSKALAAGLGTDREKERYLRVRLWWATNDPYRHTQQTSLIDDSQEHSLSSVTNLKRLSQLLDETNLQDRLMKAEIAREIDNFEEAIALLNKSIPPEFVQSACTIRYLAQKKYTLVSPLPLRQRKRKT